MLFENCKEIYKMKSEIKPIADLNRVRLADAVPIKTPFALYLFHTNVCNSARRG